VPVVLQGSNQTGIRTFDNMSAARQYVEEDGTAQVGGIGTFPGERVSALNHYRLVKASENLAYNTGEYTRGLVSTSRATGVNPTALNQNQPAWVKTFERVPGATVEGTGAPPNATVTASVQMRSPSMNSTFTYTQRAQANEDGEFTMTLPYSTTGYEQYGPDNGYTDVSVRATGPYNVSTGLTTNETGALLQYGGQFEVSEGQVNGAEDGTVSVELESATIRPGSEATSDEGNQSGNSSARTLPTSLTDASDATDDDGTAAATAATPTAATTTTVVAKPR
jgi:dolichyl-diphosphooligosaccharide--protein glycosyltransferase